MRNDPINTEKFTLDGVAFTANFYADDGIMGFPWDEHDGHGPVRRTHRAHREDTTDKAPGERPLNQGGRNESQFYYDWAGAMRIARRDGWCMAKTGAEIATAVQADFDYCREWLSGDRFWIGVEVSTEDGASDSLSGIDSGYSKQDQAYALECAHQCAENILYEKRKAWRAALNEARERRYWASRDVETV